MTGEASIIYEILADPRNIEKLARELECSPEHIRRDLESSPEYIPPEIMDSLVANTYNNVLDVLTRMLLAFALSPTPEKYLNRLSQVKDLSSLDCLILEARYGIKPNKDIVEEIKEILPEDQELSVMVLCDLKMNLAYHYLQKVWQIRNKQRRISLLKRLPLYVDLRLCCWKHGITREKAKKIYRGEEVCRVCGKCRSYIEYELL